MRCLILRIPRGSTNLYPSTLRNLKTSSSNPKFVSHICLACSRQLYLSSRSINLFSRRWQTTSTIKASRKPETYYNLFPKTLSSGPPPSGSFHIDVRELRREFLQLQAIAHPDRHSPGLKLRAEATSARINEAYKTLQDPLLRAQYLLTLQGFDLAKDETAKVDDAQLLAEVLETREQIEDAQEEELEELRRVNDQRIKRSEKTLAKAFAADDLENARLETVRLRYWVNIKETLDG